MSGSVHDQTLALVRVVRSQLASRPDVADLDAIEARLTGPLRVAIAGRVKAGKSTLLNALVGARLAPTDAGECTKIVSQYRQGPLYQVDAELQAGGRQQLRFTREENALDVQLGGLHEDDVRYLDIQWPTSKLERVTLIDTPGLESLNDENSRRTRDFLEQDEMRTTEVDAVIYLMRHLHTTDVAFLDAYMDRSVPESSPVNAVAVLSRADEVGAGRLDAMESARKIAERYRTNDQVRGLASTVVPLAGLLAETGLTLREEEAASLRSIASMPDADRQTLLLSVGHFVDVSASDLTAEIRTELLGRFGLFGVRLAVEAIRDGATTASDLAPILTEASGLRELEALLQRRFLPRARVLQSRTALGAVRGIAKRVQPDLPEVAASIEREIERIEATTVEFAQMRAAHLLASGIVTPRAGAADDLDDLLLFSPAPRALGLPDDAAPHAVMAAAGEAIGRWRTLANDTLVSPSDAEVYEAAARTAETMYLAAQQAAG
ncbi:MAG: dynamin family protein [Actinomycetota bacterium]